MVQILATNTAWKFIHSKFSMKLDITILFALAILNGLSGIYAVDNDPLDSRTGLILSTEPSSSSIYKNSNVFKDKNPIWKDNILLRKRRRSKRSNDKEFSSQQTNHFKADTILHNSVIVSNRSIAQNQQRTTITIENLLQSINTTIKPLTTTAASITQKKSTKILNILNEKQINANISLANLNTLQLFYNLSEISVLNASNSEILQITNSLLNIFPNLIRLDLSKNQIISFNVSTKTNHLIGLDLSTNRISSFSGYNLQKLKVLNLSCNNISTIFDFHLNELNDLEILDLSGNLLYDINGIFSSQKILKALNLAWNKLEKIHKNDFSFMLDIGILNLSHNDIAQIENDSLTYLLKLEYLDLSNNNLSAESIQSFQSIPELTKVSVAFNPIGNALQAFITSWSLRDLDASGSGLSEIPTALAQLIHALNISNNDFQLVQCGDLDSYPQLQRLDISSCRISEVEDDALGRLEMLNELHLNNNNITHIPLSLPRTLLHLFIQNNRIAEIHSTTFNHLVNLETIDLSGNNLIYLPGLPLSHLITLNLRYNEIKSLSQSIIKMSPKLKSIWLDGNPIKCTEILSIAEWASPCRKEKLFESSKNTKDETELTMETITSFATNSGIFENTCACVTKQLIKDNVEGISSSLLNSKHKLVDKSSIKNAGNETNNKTGSEITMLAGKDTIINNKNQTTQIKNKFKSYKQSNTNYI